MATSPQTVIVFKQGLDKHWQWGARAGFLEHSAHVIDGVVCEGGLHEGKSNGIKRENGKLAGWEMTCAQPCWVEHWQLRAGWKGKGRATQLKMGEKPFLVEMEILIGVKKNRSRDAGCSLWVGWRVMVCYFILKEFY